MTTLWTNPTAPAGTRWIASAWLRRVSASTPTITEYQLLDDRDQMAALLILHRIGMGGVWDAYVVRHGRGQVRVAAGVSLPDAVRAANTDTTYQQKEPSVVSTYTEARAEQIDATTKPGDILVVDSGDELDLAAIIRDDTAERRGLVQPGEHWSSDPNDDPMCLHVLIKYARVVYRLGEPIPSST